MRYEQATSSPFLLPEKSATVQNVDSRTALKVRAITKNVKEVTLYPGQKFTYINAECYIQSVKQGLKVRVGIYPVAIEGESGSGAVIGEGKSAYEIAVDYGFVGTEKEWLASLKGKDGANGADGVTPQIEIGDVTNGNTASASISGTTEKPLLNLTLPKGDKDEKGDKGEQGIQGEQGNKGDKGDPGQDGVNGLDGIIPKFTIGTVTSGSLAAASITGTSVNPLLNLTLPKGDKGEKGDKGNDGQDGKSFTIHSQYATYEDLITEHETGKTGDAYFVGTDANPDLYVWLADTEEWLNVGKLAGVKGDKGEPGDSIFGVDENGVYMTIEETEEETQNGD